MTQQSKVHFLRSLILALSCALFAMSLLQPASAADPYRVGWSRSSLPYSSSSFIFAFSPDGQYMAFSRSRVIRIVKVSDGMVVDTIETNNSAEALAWSPNSAQLYVGGLRDIWRYTVSGRTYIRFFQSPDLNSVLGLAVSPDGTKLAAVGSVSGIENYQIIPTGTGTPSGPYVMPNLSITKVAWAGNSNIVVNGPNIFNLSGTLTVSNPSTTRDFTVHPLGTDVCQISSAGTQLRCVRVSDGAQLWLTNLAASLNKNYVQYFANGAGLAFIDSDSNNQMAIQTYAAGSALLARTRIRSDFQGFAVGFGVVPTARRILLPFEDRNSVEDFGRLESYEVSADLTTNSRVSSFYSRYRSTARPMPTTLAPGTANARPGVAYHSFEQNANRTMVLDGALGLVSAEFPRTTGNSSSTSLISRDGRHILFSGPRETGTVGYHIYKTSDNLRLGSFDTTVTNALDLGDNGVFAAAQSGLIRVFSTNLTTGVITNTFNFPTDWNSLELSPDGSRLASQDAASNELWIRNTATGAVVCKFNATSTTAIRRFEMVNETHLFTTEASGDQFVGVLWNVSGATPQQAARVQTLRKDLSSTFGVGTISPDLKYIVLVQSYLEWNSNESLERRLGVVHLFRASDSTLLQTWENPVTGEGYREAMFSTDSSQVYISRYDDGIFTLRMPISVAVTLNPTSVVGGNSTTGTVTLSENVPAATTVSLTSSSDRAVVPATVIVAAGAKTASFTVNTRGVNSTTNVRITGTLAGQSGFADLSITRVSALTVNVTPNPVNAGSSAAGTVTLNGQAGSTSVVVNLSSSVTGVGTVTPATLTFAAGESSKSFTFAAAAVPSGSSSTVTANAAALGFSGTRIVNVTPSAMSLTFDPATVKGGNALMGTIVLPAPAPTGGRVITLASSNAAIVPSASVTIAAGQTTRSFALITRAAATNSTVTMTASSTGLASVARSITVQAPVVESLKSGVTTIIAGTTTTITILLDGIAPSGFSVAPTSSNTNAGTVPASVTFTAGQNKADFTFTSKPVTVPTSVTVSAGGKSIVIRVLPAP